MLDGVVVGNLLISLLKHADRVTSASTQPGVLLAIHNASLVGASPGTHRGHTVKSSNSKQGKTTTGLIPSDSHRGSPRTRWGRPSSTCSFKAAALARPSSMTNGHQRSWLQPLPPPCPRTPNTDRRWLSLAVNSEAGIRHWTALTIDHHLALDTLVMRRSGRHDAHLRQRQQDHYPTTTPPQHSGGASLTSYRKRRTNTRPPRGSPSDPAHDHRVTRPAAATQATLGAATRVPERAAENVDASQCRRSVSRSRLPNPSTDRGRLVRGGAWHFVRYGGYDISVKDGSARRSRQLPGCL